MKKLAITLATLLGLALMIGSVGCGGGEEPTPSPTLTPIVAPSITPAPTQTPAATPAFTSAPAQTPTATLTPSPTPTQTLYATPTPAPTTTMTLFLEIDQPTDGAQVSTGSILVSGKTIPGAVVSALVNDIISIAEVNQNGDFTVTLILEEGPNLIEVVASDSQGNQKSSTIAVIYVP